MIVFELLISGRVALKTEHAVRGRPELILLRGTYLLNGGIPQGSKHIPTQTRLRMIQVPPPSKRV
jgi:hypothetical protein